MSKDGHFIKSDPINVATSSDDAQALPERLRPPPPCVTADHLIAHQFVREKDVVPLVKDLTSERFQQERIGSPGIWWGDPIRFLNLPGKEITSPLDLVKLAYGKFPADLDALAPASRNPERIALWRVDIRAPASLSALYAAAPPGLQDLVREAHFVSSWSVVMGIMNSQVRIQRDFCRLEEQIASPLAALFQSGGTIESRPCLQTTALFLPYGVRSDGSTRQLHYGVIPYRRYEHHYDVALESSLSRHLGSYPRGDPGSLELACVPQRVVQHFATGVQRHGQSLRELRHENSSQPARVTLESWRHEAKTLGWGPIHVEAMVGGLKLGAAMLRASKTIRHAIDQKAEALTKLRDLVSGAIRSEKQSGVAAPSRTNEKDQGPSY